MKFRNNPYFRNLALIVVFLMVSIIICISNIIKLNVFAMVMSLLLIVSMCFVLGYTYSDFEKWQKTHKEIIAEAEETPKAEATKTTEEFNKL